MPEDLAKPWHELWATFSVQDHLRPGAFVPEVLLYDKLLLPVPPTEEHGLSAAEAEEERRRWADWDPERQAEIVRILGDRVEPIPWTAARRAEWRQEIAKGFTEARRDGYFMTGTVLLRFAPAMARSVVAVSQYRTLAELEEKADIRRREPDEKIAGSSVMAVLGHELLLPDDPEASGFTALEEAVAVARDDEYRGRRKALHEWQRKFMTSDSLTDAASVRAAVTEMQKLVAELETASARQKRWRHAKRFFSFLGLGAKAAALAGPAIGYTAATGVVGSVGSYVAGEFGPGASPREPDLPAATLLLDAREKLHFE